MKDNRAASIMLLLAAIGQIVTPPIVFSQGFEAATAGTLPVLADPNPASPAGYAFAIWGPIFIGALIAALLQLGGSRARDPGLLAARWPTTLGYLASIAWMWAAPSPLAWATVPLIIVMLASLGHALVSMIHKRQHRDAVTSWFIVTPLGLYVGWLTAATFVNAADVLPAYIGGSVPGLALGIAVLIGASGLALWLVRRVHAALGYVAAVLWALAGIIAANLMPVVNAPIVILAALAIISLAVVTWRVRAQGAAHA